MHFLTAETFVTVFSRVLCSLLSEMFLNIPVNPSPLSSAFLYQLWMSFRQDCKLRSPVCIHMQKAHKSHVKAPSILLDYENPQSNPVCTESVSVDHRHNMGEKEYDRN